jgi:hypothetical protein
VRRFLLSCVALFSAFVVTTQTKAQGLTGYFALNPQNGDNFGNWTRTGKLNVDNSAGPTGSTLKAENESSGSLSITVPATSQYNVTYRATIVGDASIRIFSGSGVIIDPINIVITESTPPAPAFGGDYRICLFGQPYGFELRAGANSSALFEIRSFSTVPEPSSSLLFLVGAALCFGSKIITHAFSSSASFQRRGTIVAGAFLAGKRQHLWNSSQALKGRKL